MNTRNTQSRLMNQAPGSLLRTGTALAAALLLAGTALAQGSGSGERKTRDIVLDAVSGVPSIVGTAPGAAEPVRTDAMLVSVLVESLDGTLSPRSIQQRFQTGERFRIRLLAAREARVSLYNTTPRGEFNPKPIWQGRVSPGQETLSERLALTDKSGAGVDQLHIVLEPDNPPQGVIAWLQDLLRGSRNAAATNKTSRDIVLDVDNTSQTTYLINPGGQGLVSTLRIFHTP